MGVYIKGMEMPEIGEKRTIKAEIRNVNGKVEFGIMTGGYYCCEQWKYYPLVEVPPHGRLGDLDRLEQMFADIDNAPYSGFDGTEPFYSAEDAAQIIRLAPTIIEAEETE